MENHFPTLIWFLGAMQSAQNNEYLVGSITYVLDFLLHQQRPHQKPTIFHCKSKKLTKSLEGPLRQKKTWDYQKALTKSVITS